VTVRLTVDTAAWRAGVDSFAGSSGELVPVVKGNGYGFGLVALAAEARRLSDTIAVGSVHEARTVAPSLPSTRVVVLTPFATATTDIPRNAVPTVGSELHVGALVESGWRGDVSLKLASSMGRYGTTPADVVSVAASAATEGLRVTAHMLHLPLLGGAYTEPDAVREIEGWLPLLDPALPLSVSHVPVSALGALRAAHPQHRLVLRAGTALWHRERSTLHLDADVIDVRAVRTGACVGYRQTHISGDGSLVMVGAGSVHGVAPLPDGRSPFHHARRRLVLVEPPHMHTSMVFVPAGEPCPRIGERVDLQRPLTTTLVDEIVWRD
jgi:alanine racemase